jgi:hypothetical protein
MKILENKKCRKIELPERNYSDQFINCLGKKILDCPSFLNFSIHNSRTESIKTKNLKRYLK